MNEAHDLESNGDDPFAQIHPPLHPAVPPVAPVVEFRMRDLSPPVDDPRPTRNRVPQRGIRKRVLGCGEGDYCIYVVSDGTTGIPAGALLPVDGVPRFENAQDAKRWLVGSSGDLLAGKQVIVFKAVELINIIIRQQTQVELQAKMKIRVDSKNMPEVP